MVEYYNPKSTKENYITSVDKIIILFDATEDLVYMIKNGHDLSETFPWLKYKGTDTRTFRFRHHYIANYNNVNMTVMLCYNSKDHNKCRIELNPNKCFNDPNCIQNIQDLLKYSSSYSIDQLDIATDIPKSPDLVSIIKDQRSSFQYNRGKNDKTEYLGKKRNKPGRVKKYDKAKESKLDHPLTRIEVTVGNPAEPKFRNDLNRYLPEMYIKVGTDKAVDLNSTTLNDTERVLVELLISDPENIKHWNMLGRKMKDKTKPYVFSEYEKYEYDVDRIILAAEEMIKILNFDFVYLENGSFKRHLHKPKYSIDDLQQLNNAE